MGVMSNPAVALVTEKLREATENTTILYEAGVEAGKVLGGGISWDCIQAGGKRTNYEYVFRDTQWDKPFDPTYPLGNVTKAQYMFANSKVGENLYTDKLDFSRCEQMVATFWESDVTKLKKIDMRACSASYNGAASTFWSCKSLKEITEYYPSTKTKLEGSFWGCDALETINFCSEIAVNGLNFQWSARLSRASIESIITALSDTTSGLSITLSKAAVNKAFETSDGANDGEDSLDWGYYLGYKQNWTISLV